jgi:acetyl-CoA acetyltransferase
MNDVAVIGVGLHPFGRGSRPSRRWSWEPTPSGWVTMTSVSPSAWTTTRAAPSPRSRHWSGVPSWYAENGQYLTTKFFGMKANRYLHDHGISTGRLAKVAAKNFRNGAFNPNAFRRKPISKRTPSARRC